ncbi:phosphoserine aminotransferase [Brevundimonas intermedia]|uniref:Phosphoserine aminotransferase n=1 Tax=Brevundimonas intermedia TaxID=74315 RepID=A0ABQ5T4F4_9CAUL|nr:phosphoserine transaminase [Brevundimonas intermedia]GLK47283.1 phosphoserine aminotransferase [Brevundimonas intermedia]
MIAKPDVKPARPWFSAGPTAKRPGYSLAGLPQDLLGRGIRAPEVVERFAHGLRLTRAVLEVPESHVLVYTPGSDTGAVEAALWGMLGARPVQVVAFENFGLTWLTDVKDHLGLEPEVLTAPWGELPDLSVADWSKDVVFPWNGTTSGVRVPDADWIADDRQGLAICDATSAAFAMPLPWDKLDVVTFSFQKALGGEAGIGVMALSPRAVARLDSYRPDRAIPKLLRLTDGKGFDRALGQGVAINTFSILTIEDWIDALEWAQGIGGLSELIRRTDANYAALAEWVARTAWIDFLPERPEIRSTTSVCLKFTDPRIAALDAKAQKAFVVRFKALLEDEAALFDMEPHRNAPPGLRLWCGCTVEVADVVAATPWLEWAFETAAAEVA